MAEEPDDRYDVFVSYSPEDREWVDSVLLVRLDQAGLRVAIDHRTFAIGAPRLLNIERAVERSWRTVVVLTPAWVASEWNIFVGLLVRAADPAARRRRLLPLLLKSCEVPADLAMLERVDVTDERRQPRELQRLVDGIVDVIPVQVPWTQGQIRDRGLWLRWLHRYRRPLRRWALALAVLVLVACMLLQLPPFFAPRLVWTSLGIRAQHATQLVRAGDVLLIGGANPEYKCDAPQQGLWRSPDNGRHWMPIPAPLQMPNQQCTLADIVGFAVPSDPAQRMYAATSDVGLLFSDDVGQTWQRAGQQGLTTTQLLAVAVNPANAMRVFVAAKGGGLYRSDDGGRQWQRLDRQPETTRCVRGRPLTGTLAVGALMALPDQLVVGTSDPNYLSDIHVPSGLYVSADGGEGVCWQQLHGAGGRYEYLALAYAPRSPIDYILLYTHDWNKEPSQNPHVIWRLDARSPTAVAQPLWEDVRGDVLFVEGDQWFYITQFGKIKQGAVGAPGQSRDLPAMWPCVLLCEDLAMTASGGYPSPLLLADERVFALEQGPWWRGIWP